MQPFETATNTIPQIPIPSFSLIPSTVSLESIIAVVITIIFIWWAIFSFVAMYHLLRYGRDSWLAVPAVVLHFFVSGWIFVFATGGLH